MNSQPMMTTFLKTRLRRARLESLKPPPKLNLVEWADEYRQVNKKNSANPGQWQTGRVPVAIGPYMAVTELDTDTITVVAGTQIMKTEWLLNTAAYFIHQDPASVLFIQPTQKLAEDFSKERFAPTRESTPALRQLIPDSKSRDSGVTITHKEYPGGTLDFVGANSPVDLASRPKRIVLADEIDKYPASAGAEGDPLSLGEERSSTFWNRKKLRACSPTVEATSRVWQEYLLSDQRRCFVECVHCGHEQVLKWSKETVIWEKDADGNHLPETVRYHCEDCGAGWSEADRRTALRDLPAKSDYGWRQTKPFKCCGKEHQPSIWTDKGRSVCPDCETVIRYEGHAGFIVSKLYSTRHRLSDLVKEWLGAQKAPEKLRKFFNTALADVWREKIEVIDPKSLAERREPYTHLSAPGDVLLVVAGVDTQDDRLEITFLGFGIDEEIWVLRHEALHGDTAKKDVWDKLDELLKEPVECIDGRRLMVQATCIDSQGHRGAMVHAFCRARSRRRIYATKGVGNDARGSKLIWPKTPSRTKNKGDKVYIVGVDTAKDSLAARLALLPSQDGTSTPYAVHFPVEGLTADYFDQLTAEKAVTVLQASLPLRRWFPKEEDARNEALDCFVYGMAARLSLPNKLTSPGGSRIRKSRKQPAKESADNETKQVAPVAVSDREERRLKRIKRKTQWRRR